MAKNRNAVTCNGRASFYACMWEDIRNCAMDNGWAVAIHGSLNSDMDIMVMPWVEEAVSFEELIDKISKLFSGNAMSEQYVLTYDEKTHNRVVATIPIWADFYLDISTILTTAADVVEVRHARWIEESSLYVHCSICKTREYPREHNFKSKICPECGAIMDGERREE